MFLNQIKYWAPFKIDALGLVTILGAAEVDISVGRLTHNCIAEWLPLLGAYTVANNQILKPFPGFVLYNTTDGIMAIDLSSWLTRWLLSFPLTYCSTVLRVRIFPRKLSLSRMLTASLIGGITCATLITLSILIRDWWGLANSLAMTASVLVRKAIVDQNRRGVDIAFKKAQACPEKDVKLFITMPSGKSVTVFAPRKVVLECFLSDPKPPNTYFYWTMRIIGWISFGIHVIALGMTSLFNQILSVFILTVSSVIAVLQIGDHHNLIGSQVDFDISLGDPNETRTPTYARLNLNEQEEESMIRWNMFPHRTNEWWWQRYRKVSRTLASCNSTTLKSSPIQRPLQLPSGQQSASPNSLSSTHSAPPTTTCH